MWIDKYATYAFASSPEVLKAVSRYLKCGALPISAVQDNVELIFEASGALKSFASFVPRPKSYGALDARSLGYSVTGQDEAFRYELRSLDKQADVTARWAEASRAESARTHIFDSDEGSVVASADGAPEYRESGYEYFDSYGRRITAEDFDAMPVDDRMRVSTYDGARKVG
jgi:hypothetical protein